MEHKGSVANATGNVVYCRNEANVRRCLGESGRGLPGVAEGVYESSAGRGKERHRGEHTTGTSGISHGRQVRGCQLYGGPRI